MFQSATALIASILFFGESNERLVRAGLDHRELDEYVGVDRPIN
jgi:hypothetical protein